MFLRILDRLEEIIIASLMGAATVLTLISLPALRCLVSGHGAGVIAEAMSGDAVIGWRV